MRETLPWGGHHLYDRLVAPRVQPFYERLMARWESGGFLDVGCGPGHLAAAVAAAWPDQRVGGVDLDRTQLRIARRHHGRTVRLVAGASHALPFGDRTWERLVSTESFHHWSRPEDSLTEAYRVLRPGGSLTIVEGCGDITRDELASWSRADPANLMLARVVFRRHGYTPRRLALDVLPLFEASPFRGCRVRRSQGWWVLEARRPHADPGAAATTDQVATASKSWP